MPFTRFFAGNSYCGKQMKNALQEKRGKKSVLQKQKK